MAKGSLKDPFKKVSGSQVGSAAGMALGSIIPGVGTAIGGAVGGVLGGLFGKGGNQAQAGPSQAEQDLEKRMKSFENYTFQTTNPYEDMQVNTQAAEFQRDMQAQQQADINMAEVTGQEQARLAADQARMDRSSQLLGAGISLAGTLGSSFIESGGLQPKTTTDTNTTASSSGDTVYKPANNNTSTDVNFFDL
jgi:hypothetical protein